MKNIGLTIIEAIKSRKPFRIMGHKEWIPAYVGDFRSYETKINMNLEYTKIIGNIWEIRVEKKTKRYWIWDVKFIDHKCICKCHIYLDESCKDTDGLDMSHIIYRIKKHENEFVDVEVEE